jgi:hypothetical protein
MDDDDVYHPRHFTSGASSPIDSTTPRNPPVTVPSRTTPIGPQLDPAAPSKGRLPGPLVAFAVLLVEAAFIASYVGGLHAPTPKDVPVAVVGSAAQVARLGGQLDAAASLVALKAEPTRAAAVAAIEDRHADGGYVLATGELIVASGRGPALSAVLTPIFIRVSASTGHDKLTTTDIAPLPSQDARGLVSFYLVIGWIVGGYLLAAVLGLVGGMTPSGLRSALARMATVAGYAIVSGVAGAAIVDNGFGYATGHFWPLAGIGALLVFSVGVVTVGLEAVLGLVGTAVAILAFVVAGNPSAGGPWPTDLSPRPWRQVGPYLPNGAGVTGSRQILFFDGRAIMQPLVVLAAYAIVGIALTLVLIRRGRPLVNLT